MHGQAKQAAAREIDSVLITPETAGALLDHNTINRPLKQPHVERIAAQIRAGKWRFNGDTIKIAANGDILDGQHRLWAILEAKRPVQTIIVRGIESDAFSTIDCIRQVRTLGDTAFRLGVARYRNQVGAAMAWLLRWQRGVLETYRDPKNRIENSDIEDGLQHHAMITRAVERVMPLRNMTNTAIFAFIYYALSNKNPDLAERMVETLTNPAGVGLTDPFFLLRQYLFSEAHARNRAARPLVTIALAIKACNAAHAGKGLRALSWKSQGKHAEPMPTFNF